MRVRHRSGNLEPVATNRAADRGKDAAARAVFQADFRRLLCVALTNL